MTPMRPADGSNVSSMARGSEPIMDGGADAPALDRRLTRAVMTGDQENDAVAACNRLIEATVDRDPSRVEVHPMEIDHAVGH
jgi:hypothetical protein